MSSGRSGSLYELNPVSTCASVEWQRRQKKMLSEKIDVTAFLLWFVENYPESADVMKTNPEFQNRFRS